LINIKPSTQLLCLPILCLKMGPNSVRAPFIAMLLLLLLLQPALAAAAGGSGGPVR
jgi:hypothetical protein